MGVGRRIKYRIIREAEFDAQSLHIAQNYSRLAELDAGIDWALSRKPHAFDNVAGEYYLWTTEKLLSPDFPQLRIFYRIIEEEQTVILINIEAL